MKASIGDTEVIVGKRVSIGAALGSIAAIAVHFVPEHAPAITASVVPLTFIIQVLIAHYMGVTK